MILTRSFGVASTDAVLAELRLLSIDSISVGKTSLLSSHTCAVMSQNCCDHSLDALVSVEGGRKVDGPADAGEG